MSLTRSCVFLVTRIISQVLMTMLTADSSDMATYSLFMGGYYRLDKEKPREGSGHLAGFMLGCRT